MVGGERQARGRRRLRRRGRWRSWRGRGRGAAAAWRGGRAPRAAATIVFLEETAVVAGGIQVQGELTGLPCEMVLGIKETRALAVVGQQQGSKQAEGIQVQALEGQPAANATPVQVSLGQDWQAVLQVQIDLAPIFAPGNLNARSAQADLAPKRLARQQTTQAQGRGHLQEAQASLEPT